MMVQQGDADAFVSGLTYEYPEVIRPALQVFHTCVPYPSHHHFNAGLRSSATPGGTSQLCTRAALAVVGDEQ